VAYDEHLAERIREIVAGEPGLVEKRMFGGLAFLINGNMAVAASGGGGLLLRVDPAKTEELVALPGAQPFVMRGKAMAGWLLVDEPEDDGSFAAWLARGVGYAKVLKPK